jgi:hypothetical protein
MRPTVAKKAAAGGTQPFDHALHGRPFNVMLWSVLRSLRVAEASGEASLTSPGSLQAPACKPPHDLGHSHLRFPSENPARPIGTAGGNVDVGRPHEFPG